MKFKLNIFTFFIFLFIMEFTCIAYCENISDNSLISNISKEYNGSIIIAERDVLSFNIIPNNGKTADFMLILFHETWVFNNGNTSKNVTIYNEIPQEKNKVILKFPLFGKNAIIEQSLIPNYFNSNKTTLLGEPEIEKKINKINYKWNNVTINPGEAVISAYANFYKNGSEIYNLSYATLPSVNVIRSYNKTNSNLIINYTIKNIGSIRLNKPRLVLFIPLEVEEKRLFNAINISVNNFSRADIFENTYYNDGTGNISKGYMIISNFPQYLNANEQFNLDVNIIGTDDNEGIIIPSFIISYTEADDFYNTTGNKLRLSPPTQIVSDEINTSQFYYYDVSIAIPENNCIIITNNDNWLTDNNDKFILGILCITFFIITLIYIIKKLKM